MIVIDGYDNLTRTCKIRDKTFCSYSIRLVSTDVESLQKLSSSVNKSTKATAD